MTQEKFDELVQKLEIFSRKHPNVYMLKVAALGAFGYMYILLIIAFLVGMSILMVALDFYIIKYGSIGSIYNKYLLALPIIFIVPAFILLRSLWITFPEPEGIELHRKQVPELFARLKILTKSLQASQFHRVLLTSEFNASVVQIPRLGILGWQKNFLILGLPLLQALSPEQFQAILAHEIGHLSSNHSRFAGWIYRVRKTWMQVLERYQVEPQSGAIVINFKGFINWYSPLLNAYSFVLARANEYEADRCAAESVGNVHMAEALISVSVKSQFLEKSYWTNIFQQVNDLPQPPSSPFTQLTKAIHSEVNPEQTNEFLQKSLALKTDNSDTHPCLRDRLQALGFTSDNLPATGFIPVTAAEKFLGSALVSLTKRLDRDWYQKVKQSWKDRFIYIQSIRISLQALEEKAKAEILNLTDAWNRAFWTSEIMGDRAALPLAHNVVAMQIDHAGANYLLGKVLIADDDPQGIEHLKIAMNGDDEAFLPSCELIYGFLKNKGEKAEAEKYRQQAQGYYEKIYLAQQERDSISNFDALLLHNLPKESVNSLCQQLAAYTELEEAYLVRKNVKYFPEKPMYILAIKCKHSFLAKFQLSERALKKEGKAIAKITKDLQFPFAIYITVFAADGSFNKNEFKYVLSENYLKKIAKKPIYKS